MKIITSKSVKEDTNAEGMMQSFKLADYNIYIMTLKEKIFYILLAAFAIGAVAFIFYHSVIISTLLSPLAFFYPRIKTREIIEARKKELNIQFKDMLYSLSSSLSAGRSIELAFREVLKDLRVLYPDPDASIIKETEYIVRKIETNETVESALADLAKRSGMEDIENFADVFYISKRSGGNIVEIIKNATNIINDKIEIRQEIETLLAEKKFEQKVLNVMPILMVLLLSFSAGDYVAPIFSTILGRITMTVAILLLLAAYYISKRIMNIRV